MCRMCDDPTWTRDDELGATLEGITRHGWAVQAVEGDRIHPPWAYTVGLTLRGLPEVVVTGMTATQVHPLIEGEARRWVAEGAPEPGERLRLEGGRTAEVVAVGCPEAHLFTAVALFPGRALRAAQLVWCDDRGGWPWERGFRSRRGGQPVLGARTPA